MSIQNINSSLPLDRSNASYQADRARVSSFEAALQAAAKSKDVEQLKQVATDFEEIFLNMMMSAMRQTVGHSGLFEESNQAQIFQGMLDESFAEELAKAGGTGIKEMIVEQMKSYIDDTRASSGSSIDISG